MSARVIGACALSIAALFSPHCAGAEWRVGGDSSLRSEYDDNYGLRADSTESAWIGSVASTARFTRETEHTSLTGSLGASFNEVRGDSERNNDTDVRAALASSVLGERWSGSVDAAFVRSSTQEDEFEQTGIVLERTQRNHLSLSPALTYRMTDRLSLQSGASFVRSRYEDNDDGRQVDFDTHSASVSLRYSWSPKLQLSASLSQSHYETVPKDTEQDTRSYRLSGVYSVNELWTISAGAGRFHVESQSEGLIPIRCGPFLLFICPIPAPDSKSTGRLMNVGVEGQLNERASISVAWSKDVNASGAGAVTNTESQAIELSYRWNDRLRSTVSVNTYKNSLLGVESGSETQSVNVMGAVSWSWTQDVNVDLGARYREVKYDQNPQFDADGISVYASLRYNWPQRVWAR